MSVKFRTIESIMNELILATSNYCYEGWRLHAVGTSSDHSFLLLLVNDQGKEKRINIDCFEKENNDE